MTTAVEKREEERQERVKTVRQMIQRSAGQIATALPKHMDADRFLRIAMTSFQKTPKLLECTPKSLIAALMQSAQLGLEPDGVTGQAWLIPRKNKGVLEVNFQPGYQGLMTLARNSGDISNIVPRVVYEGDEFSYHYGLDDALHHRPSDKVTDGAKPTHVYCKVRMKDGTTTFEVWSYAQIEAHRKRFSRAGEDGTWATDWAAMAKKTLIVQALKYSPKSVELSTAIALDELATSGIPQNLTATFDLFPDEDPPPKKTALQAATEEAPGSTKISTEELETVMSVQRKLQDRGREEAERHKAEAEAAPGSTKTEWTGVDKAKEKKAATARQEARKGKLTDEHLKELEEAKAASKITSDDYIRLLGVHGVETQDEVKDKDFKALLAAVKIHGGLPLK